MDPSDAEQELKDRFFTSMVEAILPLQAALLKNEPDREVTLHALIGAAEMLKERFEQELQELREELD
jgi:hypothetical protein